MRENNEDTSKLIFSQEEILELAVRLVVNPTYGWITAALIIYGCRPIEIFSLIPSSYGTASVINFNQNPINFRRKIIASPIDFVEKLNIFDQVSQPVFFKNFEDYDFDELDKIMLKWKNWFKGVNNEIELTDLRYYWAKRIINSGLSSKDACKYMGITYKEFNLKYT